MSEDTTEKRSGLAFWTPLIAASLALFIVVVDSTMMNVAVPTIVKDLKTNVTAVQGVIALYSLVMASLMLVGSKLGAVNGVKKVFIIGVLIYGVGTLVRPSAGTSPFSSWAGRCWKALAQPWCCPWHMRCW